MMDIESALKNVGDFGCYQRRMVLAFALLSAGQAAQQLQNIFVAATPSFKCLHGSQWLTECPPSGSCQAFRFKTTNFTSIVSEWDLACSEAYKAAGVQAIFMAGCVFGGQLLGNMADQYGRRLMILTSLLGTAVFGIAGAMAWSYTIYASMRFFVGWFSSAFGIVMITYVYEITGIKQRDYLSIIGSVAFALGLGLYSLLAYIFREWRQLSVITALYGLTAIYLYKILVESPRWLMSKGQTLKAELSFTKIAMYNATQIPTDVSLDSKTEGHEPMKRGSSVTWVHMLYHKGLRDRIMYSIPIWFVLSTVYYGMTLSSGSLGGNMYLSVTLSGLVELPVYPLTAYIITRYSKRSILFISLFLTALPCLGIMALPDGAEVLTMGLALFGKMSISCAYAVIFIYAAELFPTVLRNNAIAVCVTASRIGGITSPMMHPLNRIFPSLEYLVYGCLTLASSFISLRLPDTMDKPIPETLEDI